MQICILTSRGLSYYYICQDGAIFRKTLVQVISRDQIIHLVAVTFIKFVKMKIKSFRRLMANKSDASCSIPSHTV
jgi:hypothetical protein